ncbi:MAG: coenzyme F420-0:L-glutamate ligase [Anaerolineales bacterium]|nr:coenzyme F420-0:L-glutamate ligase [Anaerolineales bacterium]
MTLTLTPLEGIPLIQPGDDLSKLILDSLFSSGLCMQGGDILVLAQKIVSKAEGRLVNLTTIRPSEEALGLSLVTGKDPRLLELILQESNDVLRTRLGLIIVEHRLGFVCANAGIDHSNVKGEWGDPGDWVLLLPENPDASAKTLRDKIEREVGAKIGVMIIDSHGRAWRTGTAGVCIGLSGIPGVADLRGEMDLFDYTLRATEVGVADELAAGASLVMGQVAEGFPVVHARGFPYPLREAALGELIRPKDKDLFR